MIRVLYIGDVVGQPGRRALHEKLEHVVDREKIDFTIVNVENAAGGFGVTEAIMEELGELPINAYTSGNHIWDKRNSSTTTITTITSSVLRTTPPAIPEREKWYGRPRPESTS